MVVGDFAQHAETLVIGGGPGGYVAAIRAAQMGQSVTLIEKDVLGGVCLNVGCIPSKALIHVSREYRNSKTENPYGIQYKGTGIDYKKTQEWKQNSVVDTLTSGIAALLKKNKVNVVYGEAMFSSDDRVRVVGGSDGQSYTFDNAIIATGSRPIEITNFKFNETILDSTAALNLKKIPESLIIIGGGYIGSELAGVFANFGTNVTILEGAQQILPSFAKDLVSEVEKNFKEKGVEVLTDVVAKSSKVSENGVSVSYEKGNEMHTIEAEKVLVTVGRRPNTDNLGLEYARVAVDERGLIEVDDQGRTSVPHIYAIGDIIPGPQLAHKASYEGKVVAEVIAGNACGFDYTAIPAISFTEPEIAVVGFNPQSANDQGIIAKTHTFPLQANGRALSMNQTQGFVRLSVEEQTGAVLGAEIVGAQASELIAEITMAIESNLTVEDISLIIHAHPSLSEAIMDASELAMGLPIHI